MRISKPICLLFSLLLVTVLFSQKKRRATGDIIDVELTARTPQKVTMSTRSFTNLPSNFSLEKYSPTAGDQGDFGTCTAWANGYGAATILYAKTHNITDKVLINKYAFSPSFLYSQIKNSSDNNCQGGSNGIKALVTLIQVGDPTLRTAPYFCSSTPTEAAKSEAASYKIKDAFILFAQKGIMSDDKFVKTKEESLEIVKKALTEGSPVPISFSLPQSFFNVKTAIWNPISSEAFGDWKHNSHAMCVIGYDDNIAGGAFRVLNSWGTNWGDYGKVWIKYDDFARWCKIALQPIADPFSKAPDEMKKEPAPTPIPTPKPEPKPEPKPTPTPAPEISLALSGSLEFKLTTGEDMPVNRISSRNLMVEEENKTENTKEDLVAYTMLNSYTSGTKFRFFMNVDKDAYIYAFATDLSGKINKILPFDDLVSTYIGANSVVAFPSDTKIIKLDENKGTDYLLILYSKEKLNINNLLEEMNTTKGGLSSKIIGALGNKLIDKSKIKYDAKTIGFNVEFKTNATKNNSYVVPLMIEIKHN